VWLIETFWRKLRSPDRLVCGKSSLERARQDLSDAGHPQVQAIAEYLRTDAAEKLHYQMIRALAGLGRLVEAGDVTPARVFSTNVLEHSKTLAGIRRRLEEIVGPLERLGIRDTGQMVTLGGLGRVVLPHASLDLANFRYFGICNKDALKSNAWSFLPVDCWSLKISHRSKRASI
jgi:hypothetical protein